jgi:Domain of unknown function (DUF6089)
MYLKRFLLLFLLLTHSISCMAQRYKARRHFVELGFLGGLTNYSGDLSYRAIDIQETRTGYGAFVRYHANPNLSFKGHVYAGSISGDDRHSPTRKDRSFRFGTSLFEFAVVGEWSFFAKERITRTGIHRFQVIPYVFLGPGIDFAKPNAEYYGPPEKRQDYLKVPFPENNLQTRFFTLPIGVGFRLDVADRLLLGADVGWRSVFSDALDGIRTNGNPKKGDWYYFFGLTASIVLNDPYDL